MHVSKGYGGIPSRDAKDYFASVLFTSMITKGVTLLNMAPHSPWAAKVIEHWDYASATGVVRTILELRCAFYYLCIDQTSDDEWECRWNIFNLHDCSARIKMFQEMKASDSEVLGFQSQASEIREKLKSNAFFRSLPEKQQKRFLTGQTAYLYALEDIAEKAGVAKNTFRYLYIIFSSHVHGLPMSFYRISSGDDERGRGLPSDVEEGYTSLCHSFAAGLIVSSRDDLHKLFADHAMGKH